MLGFDSLLFILKLVTFQTELQLTSIGVLQMEELTYTVKDPNLRLVLAFGIGIHHAGLIERDRGLVERLFAEQKIQTLIATSTLAWGVNLPAHLVIVKGTEYFDGKQSRYVDFPITGAYVMEILERFIAIAPFRRL